MANHLFTGHKFVRFLNVSGRSGLQQKLGIPKLILSGNQKNPNFKCPVFESTMYGHYYNQDPISGQILLSHCLF